LPFVKLTRSKSLEVIPKETTRHKGQPHLSSESFVMLPRVVEHPVRPKREKQKVADSNATCYGSVVEAQVWIKHDSYGADRNKEEDEKPQNWAHSGP